MSTTTTQTKKRRRSSQASAGAASTTDMAASSVFEELDIRLPDELPPPPTFEDHIRRAPARKLTLTDGEIKTALANALRYVPKHLHETLAPEFLDELLTRGRIYGYRYRPPGNIKAKPIDQYEGATLEARAVQLMIDNNLDFDVALYPYELVTYGESGQVCQNWMQYRLLQLCLKRLRADQTLAVLSGHPLGVFRTRREAPRVVATNGLMIGAFDTPDDFQRACALGVANYGQMTAGGWMYIGPQGIVHGTYLTLLNAGRLYLGIGADDDLAGVLYVSSGLGGMSGAQPKAAVIAGAISVVAEVDESRVQTRLEQGWVQRRSSDLAEVFGWVREHRVSRKPLSIAYHGNVVDVLRYAVEHNEKIELLSDQTSCHAAYEGGYTPVGMSFAERTELLRSDPAAFRTRVDEGLRAHYAAVQKLVERGTKFWDYGNSFMKAVFDSGERGIAVGGDVRNGFVFPSYVEDIMGPICFDYGYGPFRWVCLSGDKADLARTDAAALQCIDATRRAQDRDNAAWIRDADKNNLVVGSQARILYADAETRVKIALHFNALVRAGECGPIMLGRDHHDTGGTDSTFRETANIRDGSNVMSDMAHQCWAGNAARGMTMCVLSNGGGVGTGKSYNGGFGLVLDGSSRVDEIVRMGLDWDAMVGVGRRSWATNAHAVETVNAWNERRRETGEHIIVPSVADAALVERTVERTVKQKTSK